MSPSATSLRAAALEYAQRGWPIAPAHSILSANSIVKGAVCTCLRGACESPGKHPCTRHGLHDATTDPAQICTWWRDERTNRNIIAPTGARSGFDVLDIDVRHGGLDSLDRWLAQYGVLPRTWTVRTASGGLHVYFVHHQGLRNSTGKIAPGIDIRASGGYVLLPPSLHACGQRHAWEIGPDDADLAAWPEWLVRLFHTPRKRPAVPPGLSECADAEQVVPEGLLRFARAGKRKGERNAAAFWLACRLVEECGSESPAAGTAMQIFGAACRPPMDEVELERTWTSAGESVEFAPTTPVVITRTSHSAPPTYHRRAPRRRVYRPEQAEEVR